MKNLKFLFVGVFFGIVLSKSQALSWYRIYEMFKFQSIHMYGIIGTAIVVGMIIMFLFRRGIIKDIDGNQISVPPKKSGKYRNILGGIIFGLGWALAGACPGPMYTLVGFGAFTILIVIFGAMLGAFCYHALKRFLPH